MSDLRTAAQQALEALNSIDVGYRSPSGNPLELSFDEGKCEAAITALRAALAQQEEPVEPVAWYQKRGQEVLTSHPACWGREDEPWTPLYTAPPQRKPLTEEEIEHIGVTHQSLRQVIRAIERAHGIKE